MKKLVLAVLALMVMCLGLAVVAEPAFAEEAAAAPDPAAMEKRMADLEAYVNNGARADERPRRSWRPAPATTAS